MITQKYARELEDLEVLRKKVFGYVCLKLLAGVLVFVAIFSMFFFEVTLPAIMVMNFGIFLLFIFFMVAGPLEKKLNSELQKIYRQELEHPSLDQPSERMTSDEILSAIRRSQLPCESLQDVFPIFHAGENISLLNRRVRYRNGNNRSTYHDHHGLCWKQESTTLWKQDHHWTGPEAEVVSSGSFLRATLIAIGFFFLLFAGIFLSSGGTIDMLLSFSEVGHSLFWIGGGIVILFYGVIVLGPRIRNLNRQDTSFETIGQDADRLEQLRKRLLSSHVELTAIVQRGGDLYVFADVKSIKVQVWKSLLNSKSWEQLVVFPRQFLALKTEVERFHAQK